MSRSRLCFIALSFGKSDLAADKLGTGHHAAQFG